MMTSCNWCKNRNTTKCWNCVGWNNYEEYNPFNSIVDINKEMKMLAKASLYNLFGAKNVERKIDMRIKKVYFNDPVTVVLWEDGTKTIVKAGEVDIYDPEKGLAMAIAKKALGNKGNYYEVFKKWLPEEEDDLDYLDDQLEVMEEYAKDMKRYAEKIEVIENMSYLTAEQYAEKNGVTAATVRRNAAKGKYDGAKKVDGKWMIPWYAVV